MKTLLALLTSLLLAQPGLVWAASADLSGYKTVLELPVLSISEPQIVELSFPANLTASNFLVVENQSLSTQAFQIQQQKGNESTFTVRSSVGNGQLLTDKNPQTYIDYQLETEGDNEATLIFNLDSPQRISGIELTLADFSQKPDFVKISRFAQAGQSTLILDFTRYTNSVIRFPEETLSNVIVTLNYTQPFRLSEVDIIEDQPVQASATLLRFLALPGKSYSVYQQPDRNTTNRSPRAGNYFSENKPLRPSDLDTIKVNPAYVASDQDKDTIPDSRDNCPQIANGDQKDSNLNQIGDTCDDTDFDSVINETDNCPTDPNPDQKDVDGDSIGDVCDDQESRFTEQYPWLPWAAMAGTVVVIIALALNMSKSKVLNYTQDTNEQREDHPKQ